MRKKYIQNEEHFVRYIMAVLRNNPRGSMDILEPIDYVKLVYDAGLADKFAWDLRSEYNLLDCDKLYDWIDKNKRPVIHKVDYKQYSGIRRPILEEGFTNEFLELCASLEDVTGVYNFWNAAIDDPLYIGKSTRSLGNRILSSFLQRVDKYLLYTTKVSFIQLSKFDAGIYELYYIAKYRPQFNAQDKHDFSSSITLDNMLEFSDGILVINKEFQDGQ